MTRQVRPGLEAELHRADPLARHLRHRDQLPAGTHADEDVAAPARLARCGSERQCEASTGRDAGARACRAPRPARPGWAGQPGRRQRPDVESFWRAYDRLNAEDDRAVTASIGT
jgi:hypothetical protein